MKTYVITEQNLRNIIGMVFNTVIMSQRKLDEVRDKARQDLQDQILEKEFQLIKSILEVNNGK